MSTGPTYVKAGEFAVRRIAGESILVPVRGGVGDLEAIFTLNPVGDVIWRELQAPRTPEQIVETLTETFEVDRQEAEKDVAGYLETLRSVGLIREVENA